MTKEEIRAVLDKARSLGIDLGSLDVNSVTEAKLDPDLDEPGEYELVVPSTSKIQ